MPNPGNAGNMYVKNIRHGTPHMISNIVKLLFFSSISSTTCFAGFCSTSKHKLNQNLLGVRTSMRYGGGGGGLKIRSKGMITFAVHHI